MCTRANASVIAVAPRREVVAALMARGGMVADLIGRQAGSLGALRGEFEQRCGPVGVERVTVSGGVERGEASAGLNGQLVQREVRVAERQRVVERRRPPRLGVTGERVDQVEADSGK